MSHRALARSVRCEAVAEPNPASTPSTAEAGEAPATPSSSTAAAASRPATGRGERRRPKVCVVGGGFGGLYTALRLSSLVWKESCKPEITLVDKSDRFVFKPLLYEYLTDELELDEVAPRFADVLPASTGVSFVQGKVARVTRADGDGAEGGAVALEGGWEIEYDYLVIAFGSGTRLDLVPGAKDFAEPFCTLSDAVALRSHLRGVESRGAGAGKERVVVVGGGVNGVELAASLAGRFGEAITVDLVTPGEDILEAYPQGQRQNAWNTLSKSKVNVRLGTKVTRVSEDKGEAGDGSSGQYRLSTEHVESGEGAILADKVLWTAGQTPVPVPAGEEGQGREDGIGGSGGFLTRNAGGNIVTDSTLRMVNSSSVFALGDIAVVEGGRGGQEMKLGLTAQVAFQQSDYVAWNVWSAINGQPLLDFQYQHLGDMMSLGQNEATVGLPIGGLSITGLPASLLRKSAYIYRMPTVEYGARLGLNWASRIIRDQLRM